MQSGWTSKDWQIWIWSRSCSLLLFLLFVRNVKRLVERVGHPRPHEGAVQQNCSLASKPCFMSQYWCYTFTQKKTFMLVRCLLRSRLGLSGITCLCVYVRFVWQVRDGHISRQFQLKHRCMLQIKILVWRLCILWTEGMFATCSLPCCMMLDRGRTLPETPGMILKMAKQRRHNRRRHHQRQLGHQLWLGWD